MEGTFQMEPWIGGDESVWMLSEDHGYVLTSNLFASEIFNFRFVSFERAFACSFSSLVEFAL